MVTMKKLLSGICLCALVCCSCGSSKEIVTSEKTSSGSMEKLSSDNKPRITAPNALQQEKQPPGTQKADQLRPSR